MPDNPSQSSVTAPSDDQQKAQSVSPAHAAYNIATDTVTGLNLRWSDNKLQAIFVVASVMVAAAVGAVLAALNPRWNLPWYGGALVGSFAGLVIGIFASGTFLMIFRAARHLKGKHD